MGRTIKLLLLYFAYQLAFFGVFTGVYMLKNGIMETSDMYGSTYMSLVMWAQFLSTLAIGLHVVLGKYVSADVFRLRVPNKLAILLVSAVFIVVMGLWTNYFSELAELPDNMKEMFEQMMNNPLGIPLYLWLLWWKNFFSVEQYRDTLCVSGKIRISP